MRNFVQPVLDFDLADLLVFWIEDFATCSFEDNGSTGGCDLQYGYQRWADTRAMKDVLQQDGA